MRNSLLFTLILLGQTSWASVESLQAGHWQIQVNKNELALRNQMNDAEVLNIRSARNTLTFIAKDAPPQSIQSIQQRIIDLKGDPKTLKVAAAGHGSVFSFQSTDAIYWFSTAGGSLLVMKPATPVPDLASRVKRKM